MKPGRTLGLLATVLGVVVGSSTSGVGAVPMPRDFGVGIQAPPVEATAPIEPGATVHLGSVYVVNTGSDRATVEVHVEAAIAPGSGRTVPGEWVSFGSNDVALGPNADAWIPVTLSIPAGAARGRYAGRIVAGTTAPAGTGGTGSSLGAAAATELLFTVGSTGSGGFPVPPWWVWAAAGGIGLVALVKRSGVRLRVERR